MSNDLTVMVEVKVSLKTIRGELDNWFDNRRTESWVVGIKSQFGAFNDRKDYAKGGKFFPADDEYATTLALVATTPGSALIIKCEETDDGMVTKDYRLDIIAIKQGL